MSRLCSNLIQCTVDCWNCCISDFHKLDSHIYSNFSLCTFRCTACLLQYSLCKLRTCSCAQTIYSVIVYCNKNLYNVSMKEMWKVIYCQIKLFLFVWTAKWLWSEIYLLWVFQFPEVVNIIMPKTYSKMIMPLFNFLHKSEFIPKFNISNS